MKTGTKADMTAEESSKTKPSKKDATPKIEVMKSTQLLDLATPLFDETPIEPSLCGENEIKLRMSHETRNMSCYIRHTRKGLLLQLPKNKLDLIVGPVLKDRLERSTQRQAIYVFPDMDTLATEFKNAAREQNIEAVAAAPAKKAATKKTKAKKADGDAPVQPEAPGKSVREDADISATATA